LIALVYEKTFRDLGSGFDRTVVANEMKKNKSKFDLDIFFDELSDNLNKSNTNLDDMAEKANGNKRLNIKLWLNPNYNSLSDNFPKIHKNLKYQNIFSVISADEFPRDYWTEYGFLASDITSTSFLIVSDAYNSNLSSYAIKMFDAINKKEFSEFPNLIYKNYKTTSAFGTIAPHEVLLDYDNDWKWNLKDLAKLFNKSLKERKKHSKELEKNNDANWKSDYDHSIKIYKNKGRKSTIVKILKEPLTLMQRFKK